LDEMELRALSKNFEALRGFKGVIALQKRPEMIEVLLEIESLTAQVYFNKTRYTSILQDQFK